MNLELRYVLAHFVGLTLISVSAAADDPVHTRAQLTIKVAGEGRVDWTEENSFKLAHCVVQAKFATGRGEEARQIIDRAIGKRPLVEYFDPEFPLWCTMDCYMRWKDAPGKYTPELKKKTKAYIAAATIPSTPTTYNHRWMLAAGLTLAYQQWGDDISYKFSEKDPTGKKWVLQELENIVRQGHGEELSPTYAKYSLGPILSLYNFCEDPNLKHKAKLTLDAMLIRRACFYFKGHTAGMIQRSYGQFLKANNDGGFMWLYVGGPENLGGATAIVFALADYRPPDVVKEIAHERDQTYQQFSAVMRNGITEWMTTYFDKSYAVGSAYPRNNYLGKYSTWFQERLTWSIAWEDDPKKVSNIFIKHPTPKYGFNGNRFLGDSPFHQVLQHEGTIIGLFDIPKDRPKFYKQESWRRQILGGFPMNPHAMIDESGRGRLYLDYGAVLIALVKTRPFEIQNDTRRGIQFFTIDADKDVFCVGYAVETAGPNDYAGTPEQRLAAYKEDVDVRFDTLQVAANNRYPAIQYESRDDVRMELGWRPIGQESIRLINGETFIPAKRNEWPLMTNPWIEQRLLGNTMHVATDTTKVLYDFESWNTSDY